MRSPIALAGLVILLLAQYQFWQRTHHILPDMSVVPDVPGQETVKALSFGDEHAFFRLLGLQIQSAGDTFGRFTALYKYDYSKLYHWFRLLDSLDNTSNYIPSMATYYYSQTQRRPDVKYIVDYLAEHAAGRVEEKWWWQAQAVYLANHKLEDKELAMRLAQPLTRAKNAPMWAQQMPAFIAEQRGDEEAAFAIMENILKEADKLTEGELNFIQYFLKERLERMEELGAIIEERRNKLAPEDRLDYNPEGDANQP